MNLWRDRKQSQAHLQTIEPLSASIKPEDEPVGGTEWKPAQRRRGTKGAKGGEGQDAKTTSC